MTRVRLSLAIAVACCATSADASIQFFNDSPAAFAAAANSSYGLLGVETFEEAPLANLPDPGHITFVSSPISQTTTTNPFPSGILQPMQVSATTGLRALRNFNGVVSTVIATNSSTVTLRLSFDALLGISAVGFNPVTPFSANSFTTVNVITEAGGLLSTSIGSNPTGTHHLGILSDPGDSPIVAVILGFSFISGTANRTHSGVDNVALYTSAAVPEASALTIWLCLGALAVLGTSCRTSRM